jgi:fatty aldehyde-generating acyl-ACP reductase
LRKFHESIRDRLPCSSSYATDIGEAVRRADLVLTATSSTQDVIEPEDLRTGAVVCEVSLPHDVSRRVAVERPDVLVVEGGNMRVPGEMRWSRVREEGEDFDMGLPRGTALACMSETMLLALENRCESYTLGRGIDLAKVREIDTLADRAGFSLADMRAFDLPISREQIARTRAAAEERRAASA